MFLFCLVFAMFCARLFICASWSPAGKGLTSWLSFVVSSVSLSLSHWYPGSGVVLDCIDSWSLQPYLLCRYNSRYYDDTVYNHKIHLTFTCVHENFCWSVVCDCGISWSYSLFGWNTAGNFVYYLQATKPSSIQMVSVKRFGSWEE